MARRHPLALALPNRSRNPVFSLSLTVFMAVFSLLLPPPSRRLLQTLPVAGVQGAAELGPVPAATLPQRGSQSQQGRRGHTFMSDV
jgi:hypothetical protein